jgi:membrane protein implicated in regulation of membrane protease activity
MITNACHDWVVDVLLWLIAGVVLAVAELFTASFFLVMFAAGAFAAAAAAGLGAPVAIQGVVFILVSLLAMLGVRPALRRWIGRSEGEAIPVGEIAGSEAVVLERVDADRGVIKIDGELWQARAIDAEQVMEPGERVRVIDIKGVTALVWRD